MFSYKHWRWIFFNTEIISITINSLLQLMAFWKQLRTLAWSKDMTTICAKYLDNESLWCLYLQTFWLKFQLYLESRKFSLKCKKSQCSSRSLKNRLANTEKLPSKIFASYCWKNVWNNTVRWFVGPLYKNRSWLIVGRLRGEFREIFNICVVALLQVNECTSEVLLFLWCQNDILVSLSNLIVALLLKFYKCVLNT